MSQRISRTKLARYAADQLTSGNRAVIRELAAYLVDSSRTGEVDLVLRAVYDELETRGIVLADVFSANKIDADTKSAIKSLTGASQLEIREHISGDVLGGIRINTASRVIDATLKNRLMKLRERKV